MRLDARVEGHDAELVQAGLSIEEHNVVVDEVALDHVAALELLGDALPVAELEELLGVGAALQQKVGARMHVGAVEHQLAHELDVGLVHALRIREYHGHVHGHGHLVDAQIRIGRDDRAAAEVHSLAAEVAAKAALFALEALTEAARELLRLHRERYAAQLAVDVERALQLQEVPVLDDHLDARVLRLVLLNCVVEEDDLGELDRQVVLSSLLFNIRIYIL